MHDELLVKLASMTLEEQLRKMSSDWDERALKNARHFIATSCENWTDDDFFSSGEQTVKDFILSDMPNIRNGKDLHDMTVLEIGCGAGRVTRALSNLFGQVYAVDISGEMVALAREALRDRTNVHIFQNSGRDLTVLPRSDFDFVFSLLVFQHISSAEVIEGYIKDVARLLKPGALFKFQVQGDQSVDVDPGDTWVGVGLSQVWMEEVAIAAGFEMRYQQGAGTSEFWLWFFRR